MLDQISKLKRNHKKKKITLKKLNKFRHQKKKLDQINMIINISKWILQKNSIIRIIHRIGVDIVVQDLVVILPRVLGVLEHYARFIILLGIQKKH